MRLPRNLGPGQPHKAAVFTGRGAGYQEQIEADGDERFRGFGSPSILIGDDIGSGNGRLALARDVPERTLQPAC